MNQSPQNQLFQFPRISEYADAISRVMRELKSIGASPSQIISLLKGEPNPPPEDPASSDESILSAIVDELDEISAVLDEITDDLEEQTNEADACAEGISEFQSSTFTAYKIASILGIYSMYGRPHAHAISAILNNIIRIGDEHKEERLLFSTEDFDVWYTRYDYYAMKLVAEWLDSNDLPDDVDGYYYTYHIRYFKD